ncbi:hypothetical protein SAMN06265368_2505 [Cohaesibacter gelatinilyticus]|uniref:Uncharacterized protein n=1 Tax=Cohaesibacter gelatinilyticus TaxID=372072 RepID=A0A285PCE9_9HYPH|nr:hypothetical protein SAMN06265368_2505 [Cohaesibacter gelatinilyticus]
MRLPVILSASPIGLFFVFSRCFLSRLFLASARASEGRFALAYRPSQKEGFPFADPFPLPIFRGKRIRRKHGFSPGADKRPQLDCAPSEADAQASSSRERKRAKATSLLQNVSCSTSELRCIISGCSGGIRTRDLAVNNRCSSAGIRPNQFQTFKSGDKVLMRHKPGAPRSLISAFLVHDVVSSAFALCQIWQGRAGDKREGMVLDVPFGPKPVGAKLAQTFERTPRGELNPLNIRFGGGNVIPSAFACLLSCLV